MPSAVCVHVIATQEVEVFHHCENKLIVLGYLGFLSCICMFVVIVHLTARDQYAHTFSL